VYNFILLKVRLLLLPIRWIFGYDLTGKTTRTLDGNTSNRANRLYEIFGFKVFGTESPPEDKKFEGFNDRSFRLQSVKAKPQFRVKKVLLEMGKSVDRRLPKYKEIIKEVEYVRKLTFVFRMLHHEDIIDEVEERQSSSSSNLFLLLYRLELELV
jgi:hypothetical protein